MQLRDFLEPGLIILGMTGTTRDAVLAELVRTLAVDPRAEATILRQLQRRELLGSTGLGAGVALPHCRTLAVSRLRVAFGLHREGVDFGAVDGRPVHAIFLIVAPPQEVSNQYLPVLGKVAQFLHDPDTMARLRRLERPEELLSLLASRGI